MTNARPAKPERSKLELLLSLVAEVRPGEGRVVVLMFVNVFLIMAAYYVLKTVREQFAIAGIQIGSIKGAEAKAYMPAIMAVLLAGVIPAYAWLGSRVGRLRLLFTTMAFVIASLAMFFTWGQSGGISTAIGVTFYVWLGIVSVFLISQFWSFANDIYTEREGKRLFAIIALGQSLGAVAGPFIQSRGADIPFTMLAASGATFAVALLLYQIVHRIDRDESGAEVETKNEPLAAEGAFRLVFRRKYLLLIGLMILVNNLVNTTGEYILSHAAEKTSIDEVPALDAKMQAAAQTRIEERLKSEPGADPEKVKSDEHKRELKKARGAVIGRFYGRFFGLVNLFGVIIQMLLVSRIFKYAGVRAALFALPVIAFGGYAAIGIIGLGVLRVAKTLENSTDYSLQNTVKQALFLPTSREEKYKAKIVIDTFFVRLGDFISSFVVLIGLRALSFGAREFALVNVGLAVIWLLLCRGIAMQHKKLVPEDSVPL